jgi:hypothetical protein
MRRLVVLVAACAYRGDYRAYYASLPGTHVALPCVELAMARVHDARAHDPVIGYAFGNTCPHRVMIDFTSLRVVARDAYRREVPLVPYDPRHEIRPLPLPAGFSGGERIEYDAPEGQHVELAELCVDVSRFAAGEGGERWTCLP